MTEQTEYLQEFFVVTETSVYHVTSGGQYRASAVKIALEGDSNLPIGSELCSEYEMLAITKRLQAFVPEKYGLARPNTDFETRVEMVNTFFWGASSSAIIALFKTKEEAIKCFDDTALEPCDKRWLESTRLVLREIGDSHPSFSVCRSERSELRLELLSAQQISA